jgi:hypothetical protein
MLTFKEFITVSPYGTHELNKITTNTGITLEEVKSLKMVYMVYEDQGKLFYFDINKYSAFVGNMDMPASDFVPSEFMVSDTKPKEQKVVRYVNGRTIRKKLSLADLPDGHTEKKRDILIKRCERDMLRFHDKTLTIINGLIYNSAATTNIMYVIGGGRSLLYRNGEISFLNMPVSQPMKRIELLSTMTKVIDNDYYDEFYFMLPEPPRVGWMPLFIIGGYLEIPGGNMITRISGNMYKVTLKDTYFLERLMATDKYVLNESLKTGDSFNITELKSDAMVKRVIDSVLTFAIYVKADSVSERLYQLNTENIPGKYKTYCMPDLPFISGHGNFIDYVSHKYDGWVLNETTEDRLKRFMIRPELCAKSTVAYNPLDKNYRRASMRMILLNK